MPRQVQPDRPPNPTPRLQVPTPAQPEPQLQTKTQNQSPVKAQTQTPQRPSPAIELSLAEDGKSATTERIHLKTGADDAQLQIKRLVTAADNGAACRVRSLPGVAEPAPSAQRRAGRNAVNRHDSVSTFSPPAESSKATSAAQRSVATAPAGQTTTNKVDLVHHTESVRPAQNAHPQLEGYCPVDLMEKEAWTSGKRQYAAVHRERVYYTSGAEQQKRFLTNPERYAPVLFGYDPVLFLDEAREVLGKTDSCLVYDGRLYVFSSRTTLEKFREDPKVYADLARQRGG